MYHIIHNTAAKYPIALLIKQDALDKDKIEEHYINHMGDVGQQVISFSLEYKKKKLKASDGKAYLTSLLRSLDHLGTETLFVTDAEYFKLLTGERKTTGCIGYIYPCKIASYEHMNVILSVNYKQLFYDPSKQETITQSIGTLIGHVSGNLIEPGSGIIHTEQYPETLGEIQYFLNSLHQHPVLACDIETFSLQFWEAGIGTIGFAWDMHNGGAFCVDYHSSGSFSTHGYYYNNQTIKMMLRDFFDNYKGKLVFHNANFDIKILVYELYMDHPLDNEGLINGLNTLTKNMDDTKIITYLATNSTAGNTLGLKENAHEFAGNYAENEISDIRYIKRDSLLRYNLVDCLSTLFVREKYRPVMIQDQQENIYNEIMLPSIETILQIELTGMPLDMDEVLKVEEEFTQIVEDCHKRLRSNPLIFEFVLREQLELCIKENNERIHKPRSAERPLSFYADKVGFNPASGPQLQRLIYDHLGYEPIDLTDTKQPATGAKTLKKLINHTNDPEHTELFETLIELGEVSKILNTFIKAFKENSFQKGDGHYYLHGSFNLGGTVSGRLSSSNP